MKYRAYIFDLDDTLYREHDYVHSGFWVVTRHMVEKYPHVDIENFYNALVQEWKANGRGKVFDQICGQFGLEVNVPELVKIYRGHQPEIKLYDDAKQCLDYLKKLEVPMALITDGHKLAQRQKIRAIGLE